MRAFDPFTLSAKTQNKTYLERKITESLELLAFTKKKLAEYDKRQSRRFHEII